MKNLQQLSYQKVIEKEKMAEWPEGRIIGSCLLAVAVLIAYVWYLSRGM